MQKLKYLCDNKRHLICIPYSIENLHIMAEDLNIKRCFFHKNHYDLPKKRIKEITAKCKIVSSRAIMDIIKNPEYGHIPYTDEIKPSYVKPVNQVLPEYMELKYNGYTK